MEHKNKLVDKDRSVSWEFIFAEWQKGATYEQLAITFNIEAKAIERHANDYGWKTIVKKENPTTSLIEQKKHLIEKSRDTALNNCNRFEELLHTAVERLADTNIKDGDLKGQNAWNTQLHLILKVEDLIHGIRSAAVNDVAGKKEDTAKAQSSTVVNILLPGIMSKQRVTKDIELDSNDIVEIDQKSNK